MVAFSSRPRFLLPFAPANKKYWTEIHYEIYDAVQLAIGQRRQLTEKELKEQEHLSRVDAIETGDSEENILDVMRDMFGTGEDDFTAFIEDPKSLELIEKQLHEEREAQEVRIDYD